MNKKCQVFTPADYVKELLDSVGYTKNLYGKKILENSCGDGNILVAIVQRYIDDCRQQGLSRTKIKNGLSRDIYGVEIDPEQYKKCIQKLNLLLEKNNINPVKWNILNLDYLRWETPVVFHFVVGNPPYITYNELDEKEQEYVKTKYSSCTKGKFDYCYAFIEKSIGCLDQFGRMSYLIPSSIFKTVFGANLRKLMFPYIEDIKDYTQEKMFDNALVKSSIMVLNRNKPGRTIRYIDMTSKVEINISIDTLTDKWFFTETVSSGERRFGDYFQVSHVVATLLNDVYVLKQDDYIETKEFIHYKGYDIEKNIIRETATPRSLRYNKTEKIIFPYSYKKGKLVRYSEDEFEQKFPGAFKYLNHFREKLDDRESDNSARWFEYGRSQALKTLNQRKLLISTVITENVVVYKLEKKCIPYAGMYIVPKKNSQYTLDYAMQILKSREFMQYVLDVGIHISGSSLRITSKDIEDYRF